MSLAEDYFARVRPLLGTGLSKHVVSVDDAGLAALVIELLASCMLEHVVVTKPETLAPVMRQHLWRQPFLPLRTDPAPVAATILARRGEPSVTWCAERRCVTMTADPSDVFGWMDVSYHVARTLREVLLGHEPWPDGAKLHNDAAWPFSPRASATARSPSTTSGPDREVEHVPAIEHLDAPAGDRLALAGDRLDALAGDRRALASDRLGALASDRLGALAGRHILVIGCGSVGSEAIRALAGFGARWTLVDDAHVTVFNLARQWYGADEVGVPKVDALCRRIDQRSATLAARPDAAVPCGLTTGLQLRIDAKHLGVLEARLRSDPPDLAILATGTHHHGMLGDLLWRLGIPHVAACCYPQARFFEVSVVSPAERTPCLHCFRGHLYRGAPEPTPITDEVANFLYAPMADEVRARAYTDLVAEPATKIETIRVAEVVARCAVELCAARRSPWFERMLAAQTTCLLGGNVARRFANGDHAYGIREPGQVIRLGVDDLAGASESITCTVCERRLDVAIRDDLPAIGDDADAALL